MERKIFTELCDLVVYYAGTAILNPGDTYDYELEIKICEGRIRKHKEHSRSPVAIVMKHIKSQKLLDEIFEKTLSMIIKDEFSKIHKEHGITVEEISKITDEFILVLEKQKKNVLMARKLRESEIELVKEEAEHTS